MIVCYELNPVHAECFTLKGIWDTAFEERVLPDISKLGPEQ